MGLFSNIILSVKKARRVRKLSLVIAKKTDIMTFLQEIYEGGRSTNQKQQALNELFDLIESDLLLKAALLKYGADRTHLEELFYRLHYNGAGVWAGGDYVAVSALCYFQTLDYLLANYNAVEDKDLLRVAERMVRYFQKNERREIAPWE